MKNGSKQVHVVYPKFKNGEAVVRNVKVQQNFGIYDYSILMTIQKLCQISTLIFDLYWQG